MSQCQEIIPLMHDYLDHDLDENGQQMLQQHLKICSQCAQHFIELEKAVAYLHNLDPIPAPVDFTANVLSKLPKQPRSTKMKLWLKSHPFVVAASLFIFLMLGSFTSIYEGTGDQFSLRTSNMDQLGKVVVKNNHVIVPEGEVIEGDIIVRNGNIDVKGEVKGNVIVIEGNATYSSTAQISGQVKEIDQVLDWMMYELKSFAKRMIKPLQAS